MPLFRKAHSVCPTVQVPSNLSPLRCGGGREGGDMQYASALQLLAAQVCECVVGVLGGGGGGVVGVVGGGEQRGVKAVCSDVL